MKVGDKVKGGIIIAAGTAVGRYCSLYTLLVTLYRFGATTMCSVDL